MDAKRTPWLVWSLGLLALCGCTWEIPPPTAHQETAAPPESQDPPQVISDQSVTDNTNGEDDVSRSVLGWIGRVEGAEQRGKRPKPEAEIGSGLDRSTGDTEAPSPSPTLARESSEPVRTAPDAAVQVTPAETDHAAASQPALPPPPALGNVAVRAAPQGRAALPDPLSPEINAPAAARGAPTSLKDFLEQSPVAPEGAFGEQLDRRMMWVIAGDYERSRAPLELVTAEQQELASRFIEAWIVVRDGHMGDPSRAASAAVRELAELQESLRRLSDLSLPVLKICSAVRSYGQYDALEPARLLAGTAAEFVLYCEVSDFASELRDGLYTTTFDMTTSILNRSGDVVLELKDADIVDRCRNRRHDCFIPRLVRLPTTLSPGQYVAKVTVVDKLGQKLAENRALFQLVARP
jgi:hypothetical protein